MINLAIRRINTHWEVYDKTTDRAVAECSCQEWAMFFRDAGNVKVHHCAEALRPITPAEAATDEGTP